MRSAVLAVAAALLLGSNAVLLQQDSQKELKAKKPRALTGKFLQITDLHPDPFYKYHSSVAEDEACHRGKGPAGVYGAETTDCDSPFSLVNATFKWIEENIKDDIDFVIWTGDSARHDNDEKHPRSFKQTTTLNKYAVSKFYDVWGKEDDDEDPLNDLSISVVPNFGNNDILPHNIFEAGPNSWTKEFLKIWRNFIPEQQRHTFAEGGYFYVEVIPNKLAVFSLNSLYFFDNNAAVDGCAKKKEPGYEQFEWLRIQLSFLRQRGMKAILIGHVPPARTDSKQSWDETCWQKYTLWNKQYRDVIVGSLWGHMNIDHFMLQDFEDVDIATVANEDSSQVSVRDAFDDEMEIESASDYLSDLRDNWSALPDPPKNFKHKSMEELRKKKGKKDKKEKKTEKFFEAIGGEWGERFSLSLVSPSVVPNYFPTLRIFEYNITGLDQMGSRNSLEDLNLREHSEGDEDNEVQDQSDLEIEKHKKKKKKNKFKKPKGPSKSTPPGPAYSPQTLTFLGYRQLYANLTVINNDFVPSSSSSSSNPIVDDQGWKDGKHPNKKPAENDKPNPTEFVFQLEYDTRNDSIYKLPDLTVRNYAKLAARIGKFRPRGEDSLGFDDSGVDVDVYTEEEEEDGEGIEKDIDNAELEEDHLGDEAVETQKKHKHKKKHKHGKGKKRRARNKVWFEFVKRAFVNSRDDEDLHQDFGQVIRGEGEGVEIEDGSMEL